MTVRLLAIISVPFALILALLAVPEVDAQTPAAKFLDSAQSEIAIAFPAHDTARLARADLLLERTLAAYPGDPFVLHFRGFAAYRRAIVAMTSDSKAAMTLLLRAESDLELSASKLTWAETPALLATVLGLQIALAPDRGEDLGPRSQELLVRARNIGPDNPRVVLLEAYAAINTPPEYGGSIERANALVRRARDLFAAESPVPLLPRWGKLECEALFKDLAK